MVEVRHDDPAPAVPSNGSRARRLAEIRPGGLSLRMPNPFASTPDPAAAADVVLVVDDEAANRALLSRVLAAEGYRVRTAADGLSALAAVKLEVPDIILLDVRMPGVDGFEVCRRLKQEPATRLTPVVIVTGLHERDQRLAGINIGADDFLFKPFDVEELRARVRSLLRVKHYTDDLESAESVILALGETVEARDPSTRDHCRRLAAAVAAFGEALGLSQVERAVLRRGAYLHDVGKIAVPDAILLKAGPLTAAEYDVMKEHAVVGERLCGSLRSLEGVRPLVRHHHELLDGTGYPDGLRGEEVPLLAQIIGISDVYDALTNERPYRAAWPTARAHDELRMDAAKGARCRDLVETFLALVRRGELGNGPGVNS